MCVNAVYCLPVYLTVLCGDAAAACVPFNRMRALDAIVGILIHGLLPTYAPVADCRTSIIRRGVRARKIFAFFCHTPRLVSRSRYTLSSHTPMTAGREVVEDCRANDFPRLQFSNFVGREPDDYRAAVPHLFNK